MNSRRTSDFIIELITVSPISVASQHRNNRKVVTTCSSSRLQARQKPLSQLVASLYALGPRVTIKDNVVSLIGTNNIGSIGENRLKEIIQSLVYLQKGHENANRHTLIFFAKDSIGDSKSSSDPARSRMRSVFASAHHSAGARSGSLQASCSFPGL